MSRRKIAIFTTLFIEVKPRKTIKEKLHLVKNHKTISCKTEFADTFFYTTEIEVFEDKKEKYLNRFRERCSVPIIERDSDIVGRFRYKITVNSFIKNQNETPLDVVLFDKTGELLFLLDTLLQKCRTVYVYTENIREYSEKSDQIFKTTGAAAVICEGTFSVNKADLIVTNEMLPLLGGIPVISRYSFLADECTCPPTLEVGKNADILCVLAGLYFICGKDLI